MKNENFFDLLSSSYDEMIDLDSLLVKRGAIFSNFIKSDHNIKKAADVGSGTGVDSIALAQKGINVYAFDQSHKMLEVAKNNSLKYYVQLELIQSTAQDLPVKFLNEFDLIVSLGNTLANLNKEELEKALFNFNQCLAEDGILILQILNYESLYKNKERIININNKSGKCFVRFYDFFDDHLMFNIIIFEIDNPGKREFISTKLYPHKVDFIVESLKNNNFKEIELYGGLDQIKYDRYNSKDLVIKCIKG